MRNFSSISVANENENFPFLVVGKKFQGLSASNNYYKFINYRDLLKKKLSISFQILIYDLHKTENVDQTQLEISIKIRHV